MVKSFKDLNFGAHDTIQDALNDLNTSIGGKANQSDVDANTSSLAEKTDKTYVDTQVAAVASGAPKGVYTTFSQLQAAFPTGNSNIYLVTGNVKEIDSLNITAAPTATGNVTVTLNGVATNIAVTIGVKEVASLTISAVPTTAGNVTITLNGVDTTVALDPATDTTTDAVATKIRNATYPNGAVTGGTGSTVTFTAAAVGVKTDATYSAGSTGATGTMSTTTQGVDADTATSVATKIRGTSFSGWTTGGTGTNITFTANAGGAKTAPSYSAGSTGATGTISVTTAGVNVDGQWYYWNSSAWIAGGTYQAAGIPNGSITPPLLSFKPVIGLLGKNLFDKTNVTTGKYVYYTSGLLGTIDTYSASDYIPIEPNTAYTVSHNQQIAFYDSNKVYISGIATPTTFTTPVNAAYVRLSVLNTNLDVYQLEKGSVATSYEAYQNYVDTNTLKISEIKPLVVDFKNIPSKNLFDKTKVTNGKYPYYTSGTLGTNADYSASDYTPIESNTTYTASHTYQMAFYDSSKVYISGIATPVTFTTPVNAAYVRIGILTANLDVYQLEKGSSKTAYEAYGNKIGTDSLDMGGIKNIVNAIPIEKIVAPSGGDFTKISDALNSITDASEDKPYQITVMPGTYIDTFHTKFYVDIIGTDKYTCIIDYTGDINDWIHCSAIFGETTCKIENLWIKNYDSKYPIHSDSNTGEYLLQITNCILEHEGFSQVGLGGTPLGIGLYSNQFIEVNDCTLIGSGDTGISGIFFHNNPAGGSDKRGLRVENCKIRKVTYGFRPNGIATASDPIQNNDAYLINNDVQASIAEIFYDASVDLSWNIISRGNTLNRVYQPNNSYVVEQPGFTQNMINNGTTAIVKGDVVTLSDTSNIKNSNPANSPLVVGVALQDIPVGSSGVIQIKGYVNACKVGGASNIAINDLLTTDGTTGGLAVKGTSNPFAIAQGSYTAGGGNQLIPVILLNTVLR